MAFATFCRHQRKPVFPPEQQLGTRQPLYPKRRPAHYGLLARLRVLISNREAFGYLCVGTAMGILFGFAFVMMTLKGYSSAGHVYSVGTYL